MSCESKFDGSDPASLDGSLKARMPEVSAMAKTHLRDAATEFFRRSLVWRDQRRTLLVNEDQIIYTLDQPAAGRIVKIIDIYCGTGDDERRIAGDTEVSLRHEEQRWHQASSRTVEFHREIEIAETYRVAVALTSNGSSGDAAMIEEYREAILAGAQYYATMAIGQKTDDKRVALVHKNMFDEMIDDAGRKYRRQLRGERKPMTRTRAVAEGRRW